MRAVRIGVLFGLVLVACAAEEGPPVGEDQVGDGGVEDGGTDDGGSTDEGDGGTTDGGFDPGGDGGEDDGFNGQPLDPAWPLPDFVATNLDGTARGPAHLTGDPSVIWFYRDAGSAG